MAQKNGDLQFNDVLTSKDFKSRTIKFKRKIDIVFYFGFILLLVAVAISNYLSEISAEGRVTDPFDSIVELLFPYQFRHQEFIQKSVENFNERGRELRAELKRMRNNGEIADTIATKKEIEIDEQKEEAELLLNLRVYVTPLFYYIIFALAFILMMKAVKRRKFIYNSLDKVGWLNENFIFSEGGYERAVKKYTIGGVFENLYENYFSNIINSQSLREMESIKSSFDEDYDRRSEEYNNAIVQVHIWMLTVGIIGTLFGIMIAFYQIANGLQGAYGKVLPPSFLMDVRIAMIGNAIAVLTSIFAELLSWIYDMLYFKKLSQFDVRPWYNKVFYFVKNNSAFNDLEGTSKSAKEKFDELEKTISNLSITIKGFDEGIIELKKLSVTDINESLIQIKLLFNQLSTSITNVDQDEMEKLKTQINSLSKSVEFISTQSAEIQKSMISINEILGKIKQALQTVWELIKHSFKDLAGNLSKAAKKIADYFKKDE